MGDNCRYNGETKANQKVIDFVSDEEILKVCPECLGQLPTPRPPAQVVGGTGLDVIEDRAKVMTDEFEDVTKAFLKGAEETLALAKKFRPDVCIFKARSPSCGCGQIYDGTFSKKLITGDGVATALLKNNGFRVITEEDIE